MKIDLAALADRIQHRGIRVGDPVKLVSLGRSAGLTALEESCRLHVPETQAQDEVEMAPRLAER